MKKIAINIYYNGENFTSNYEEFSTKSRIELEDFLTNACEGKIRYIQITSGNRQIFFPQDIIQKSIISILEE